MTARPRLYAVYNGDGNFVRAYVLRKWADRKAGRISGGYVVTYAKLNSKAEAVSWGK